MQLKCFNTMHINTITPYSVSTLRAAFPILNTQVRGKQLVYLDNAATTQKPQQVIDAVSNYYETTNSNVHRGVHFLSQKATDAFEQARNKVAEHFGVADVSTCIFVRGTTEAINVVAHGFGRQVLKAGQTVLVSAMEHHSNIVPWQMACEQSGATLKVIPMDATGTLDMQAYADLLRNNAVKLVAVNHISNALGTINPVVQMVEMAHAAGAAILVDGAQSAPHMQVDFDALGADFYTISGHKMYGPTGIGVLIGKRNWLEQLPPYQGGGEMIATVSFEKTTYAGLPHKFEAGTPDISGVIGLGAAIDFLQTTGIDAIAAWEQQLLSYAHSQLAMIPGIQFFGTAAEKAGVVSFLIEGIHPYDLGTLLDQMGIAVRTGHHCAQPVMDAFQIPGTVRASFACYNTMEEIDQLVTGVRKAALMLQ
jgi:cysteine desulfurase / selenocysteine lyase